uniref:glycosyltransferase n=1 Tax=Eubacterium cellulosolvens TaxID=29322 RepID=UPI0006864D7D|nr:glycosyltransferase [[Eubacterium] cellulosolvens]
MDERMEVQYPNNKETQSGEGAIGRTERMADVRELVSIVIPVYMVEQYLEECLDSVLGQTWDKLEVLLVDDGSVDRCPEICDRYAGLDARFRVIHQENRGLSAARNAALDQVKGDCVFFLDSDDYLAPEAIEKLCLARREKNAQIVICANYVLRDGRLTMEDPVEDSVDVLGRFDGLSELIDDRLIHNYACGKLFDRELFADIRFPDGRVYEDIATTYRLFDRADRIVRIPDPLLYYRMREDSISGSVSMEKWHEQNHAMVLAMIERRAFFLQKHEEELAGRTMERMLPYLYSDIRTAYYVGKTEDAACAQAYLKKNEAYIMRDRNISGKDKKLYHMYLTGPKAFQILDHMKLFVKTASSVEEKMIAKISIGRLPFDLLPGKKRRIVFFALPCFDNLGSHAIRFATEKYLEAYTEKDRGAQLFTVGGWDTVPGIKSLKRFIGPEDVLVLQGGGNLGNRYDCEEIFRRKVVRSFRRNRIIILPQTAVYTDDEDGREALEADRKVFNRCRDLIIFARDRHSEAVLRKNFTAKVIPMKDMVLSLGNVEEKTQKRKGILLALRLDRKSSLTGGEKEKIERVCRKYSKDVFVTDTCIHRELRDAESEETLRKKWKLFSGRELIITDRLHGMIFSVITGTPCIVIGAKNAKVGETFRTINDCRYIRFLEDESRLEENVREILTGDAGTNMIPDYSSNFRKLDNALVV